MAKRTWGEAFPHNSCCQECGVLLGAHDPGVDPAYLSCLMCTGAPTGAVGPPEAVGFVYVTDENGSAHWPYDEIEEEDDTDDDDDESGGTATDYDDSDASVGKFDEDTESMSPARRLRTTADFDCHGEDNFEADASGGDSMAAYDAKQDLREYKGSARGWHQLRLAWIDRLLRKGCRADAAELCMLRYASA